LEDKMNNYMGQIVWSTVEYRWETWAFTHTLKMSSSGIAVFHYTSI
jgi:hypothetical protein